MYTAGGNVAKYIDEFLLYRHYVYLQLVVTGFMSVIATLYSSNFYCAVYVSLINLRHARKYFTHVEGDQVGEVQKIMGLLAYNEHSSIQLHEVCIFYENFIDVNVC